MVSPSYTDVSIIQTKSSKDDIFHDINLFFKNLNKDNPEILKINDLLDHLDKILNIDDMKISFPDFDSMLNTIVYLLKDADENQDELIKKFCGLVSNCKNSKFQSLLFKGLLCLFNLIEEKRHIRYQILCSLFQIQPKLGLSFQPDLKTLKNWFVLWRLKYEEKRVLINLILASYQAHNKNVQGLNFIVDFYKQLTSKDKNDELLPSDIRQCIILHMREPEVYLMDHLTTLPTMNLQDNKLCMLLNIFLNKNLSDYLDFYTNDSNVTFLKDVVGLNHEVNVKKMQILTFLDMCSTALTHVKPKEQATLTFPQICEELKIGSVEEAEDFVIEAVRTKLVKCRIDEVNGKVKIFFSTYRVVATEQWRDMGNVLKNWLDALTQVTKQLGELKDIQGFSGGIATANFQQYQQQLLGESLLPMGGTLPSHLSQTSMAASLSVMQQDMTALPSKFEPLPDFRQQLIPPPLSGLMGPENEDLEYARQSDYHMRRPPTLMDPYNMEIGGPYPPPPGPPSTMDYPPYYYRHQQATSAPFPTPSGPPYHGYHPDGITSSYTNPQQQQLPPFTREMVSGGVDDIGGRYPRAPLYSEDQSYIDRRSPRHLHHQDLQAASYQQQHHHMPTEGLPPAYNYDEPYRGSSSSASYYRYGNVTGRQSYPSVPLISNEDGNAAASATRNYAYDQEPYPRHGGDYDFRRHPSGASGPQDYPRSSHHTLPEYYHQRQSESRGNHSEDDQKQPPPPRYYGAPPYPRPSEPPNYNNPYPEQMYNRRMQPPS